MKRKRIIGLSLAGFMYATENAAVVFEVASDGNGGRRVRGVSTIIVRTDRF